MVRDEALPLSTCPMKKETGLMTNEVTTARSTSLGSLDALRSSLQTVRTRLPEGGGSQYLRLLKDGDWVFGQEDNVLSPDDEAIINPMSIKQGYSCWTNRQPGEGKNELLGEVMVNIGQPLAQAHELPQHTDPKTSSPAPWKDQIAFDLKLVTGKHSGIQLQWKTSSVGGLNAARSVIDAIITRLSEDTEFVCPVVVVASDSYKHKAYGKTYVPKLEIVGWADINGNEESQGDEPRVAAAAEPEPAQSDEEPTRRRRRA